MHMRAGHLGIGATRAEADAAHATNTGSVAALRNDPRTMLPVVSRRAPTPSNTGHEQAHTMRPLRHGPAMDPH